MPTIYNTEPAKVDLEAIQGDSIYMNFQVTMEALSSGYKFYVESIFVPSSGIDFHMDTLQMQVRRQDGVLVKDWYSGVSPAAISINPFVDGEFEINDIDGFLEAGYFNYDLQMQDSGSNITIMRGKFTVRKQYTI